jgi:cell division protein FtsB
MKKRLLIVVWLVIFFPLLLCIILGERGVIDLYRLQSRSDQLTRITSDLKRENQELCRHIDRLKNDLEYIEEIAREELGMVARDELIYQFKGEEKKKQQ